MGANVLKNSSPTEKVGNYLRFGSGVLGLAVGVFLSIMVAKYHAISEHYPDFSNSLTIHAALTQPEHLILVRWMDLEPPMKNELNTRQCLNTRV